MKEYLELMWTFASIGAVSFGGGYAMLPHIQRELVDKRQWVTREEILDYFAIGQSTPGIIAINVSSFIGYNRKGWRGSLAATLGFVLPSLVLITLLAGILVLVADHPWVQHAFSGIRIAVGALIVQTLVKFFNGAVKDVWGVLIALGAFGASFFFQASPILVVVAAGALGVGLFKDKFPGPPVTDGSAAPADMAGTDGGAPVSDNVTNSDSNDADVNDAGGKP